jgi:hypothetical protein
MLVLASSTFAGSLVIGGGAATLVGAVVTIASFTPSYHEREWDDNASKVGYLVGAPGGAILLAGSFIELITSNPQLETIDLISAMVVAATVVIVFALPIAIRRRPPKAPRRQKRSRAGSSQKSAKL